MAKKASVQPMPMADEEAGGASTSSLLDQVRIYVGASETAAATVAWGTCSVGMTLLNKIVVIKSHAPLAVVIVQMVATVGMAFASRNVHFGEGTRTWALVVPPLFALMMLSSMLALKYVTVGTFVVVRNLAPVVTLVIETAVHKPDGLQLNLKTGGACAAIALGVLIYEIREISFSWIGFLFLLANLALGVTERMAQRHLLAVNTVDVSKPGLMVLNNGLGALFSMLLLAFTSPNEWHALCARPPRLPPLCLPAAACPLLPARCCLPLPAVPLPAVPLLLTAAMPLPVTAAPLPMAARRAASARSTLHARSSPPSAAVCSSLRAVHAHAVLAAATTRSNSSVT